MHRFRLSLAVCFALFLGASLGVYALVKRHTVDTILYQWPSLEPVTERIVQFRGIKLQHGFLDKNGQRLNPHVLGETFELICINKPRDFGCDGVRVAHDFLKPRSAEPTLQELAILSAQRTFFKNLPTSEYSISDRTLTLSPAAEEAFLDLRDPSQ